MDYLSYISTYQKLHQFICKDLLLTGVRKASTFLKINVIKYYKKGVGAPVHRGSFGAIVFGNKGSGGGIISLEV